MMRPSLPHLVSRTLGIVSAFAVLATCTTPRIAVAQSGPPPIPQEAYTACESKAESDACTVHFGDRELEGSCVKEPSGSRLVCLPKDLPSPPPRE
jgi:hypothetical protein